MAETASLVLIHGEMLVNKQQLSPRANFSLRVKRSLAHLPECIGFNPIRVGNNPSDLLVKSRRHSSREIGKCFLRGSG
jgi:hypothetical protein